MEDNRNSDRSTTIMPGRYKRLSFEHEKELRVFYVETPIEYQAEKLKERNLPIGKKINTDLAKLISKVYIAPKADTWFIDLVKSVLQKYEINTLIESSTLYERNNLK